MIRGANRRFFQEITDGFPKSGSKIGKRIHGWPRCTVFNLETGKTTGVYDLEKLSGRDPYDVYLSGAAALLTIENPQGQPGRELIVLRDSFGSSMIPLLLQGYEKVTVVDTRYLSADLLGNYIEFSGQDVLFLYSTLILNSSMTLK